MLGSTIYDIKFKQIMVYRMHCLDLRVAVLFHVVCEVKKDWQRVV